jgi:hypothetical protein
LIERHARASGETVSADAREARPLPVFDRDQSRKANVPHHGIDNPDGARSMPTEIILITFIALGFCVFAGTLYWADLQTRGRSG